MMSQREHSAHVHADARSAASGRVVAWARKLLSPGGPMRSRPHFAFSAALLGVVLLIRAIGTEPKAVAIVAVDRLVASPTLYVGRYVRLDGEVVPGGTSFTAAPCVRRFVLERNGVHVTVEHQRCDDLPAGIPDGANVVAEGTLGDDGRFDARAVLARDTSPRGR